MNRSVTYPIYLDYQATTPLDPRVKETILPFLDGSFGNPHSRTHSYGRHTAAAVRRARSQVARLINADDNEIVFTSGATESCNLALRGTLAAAPPKRRRILTVATEHPAVLETAVELGGPTGNDTVILPVTSDGLVDLDQLQSAIDARTLVVSVMAANNEIGVTQPMAEIGRLCRDAGVLFHTDATQAAGRIEIDVDDWGVDLLSLSSHKIYGPPGVGALYVRRNVAIHPIMTGGGQEGGLRSGTVPAMLITGFGMACHLAATHWNTDASHIGALTQELYQGIYHACPELHLFGHPVQRIPGNLCIAFPGLSSDEVIHATERWIAISTGSACSSTSSSPSSVLLALGIPPDLAASAVRISLGRFTTRADVETAVDVLANVGPASNAADSNLTPRPDYVLTT